MHVTSKYTSNSFIILQKQEIRKCVIKQLDNVRHICLAHDNNGLIKISTEKLQNNFKLAKFFPYIFPFSSSNTAAKFGRLKSTSGDQTSKRKSKIHCFQHVFR